VVTGDKTSLIGQHHRLHPVTEAELGQDPGTAHIAFRVVQESLTNALRHAPGASVRVLVNGTGPGLTVRVENDLSVQERLNLAGTGRGLTGLRERVQERGGQLLAGPTPHGGWLVEATLPS
jgi:signal transduction histidine kinase